MLVKRAPGVRNGQTARRADDERRTELLLERRELAADGRKRQTRGARGSGQASRVDDTDEHVHVRKEVHAGSVGNSLLICKKDLQPVRLPTLDLRSTFEPAEPTFWPGGGEPWKLEEATCSSRGVIAVSEGLSSKRPSSVVPVACTQPPGIPRVLQRSSSGAKARVVPLELDVTKPSDALRASERARDVDLLINHAGVLASYGVLAGDTADMQRDIDTHFFGLLHLARAFIPVLRGRGNGALVSILSVASLANMPALGGYSSSKAAAWSLTQALRADLAKYGVPTFAVFPGPVDTDMIRSFELPKTAPELVARSILDGVEASSLDIFPDPMSREVGALFAKDPAAVAQRFAAPIEA